MLAAARQQAQCRPARCQQFKRVHRAGTPWVNPTKAEKAHTHKPDEPELDDLRRGGATPVEHLKYFEFVGVAPARRMTLWLS